MRHCAWLALGALCQCALAQLRTYDEILLEKQKAFDGKWVTVGVKVDNGQPFSKLDDSLNMGVEARYGGISVEMMKRLREFFGFSIKWVDMPAGATPDELIEAVGNGSRFGNDYEVVDVLRMLMTPICEPQFTLRTRNWTLPSCASFC